MPRPRSEKAHRKVIEAALNLIASRGFEATSMDAIAETSGVSKATIYKHWPDKDALLLELMADLNGLHNRPTFDTGNPRADIVAVLSYRPPECAELRERITPHFMAYAGRNPAFGDAWRNMVMEPPRQELRRLLGQAVEKGELSPNLDHEVSLSLLLGPIVYWYVFLRRKTADPAALAESVVDAFYRAFAPPSQYRRKAPRKSPRT
jgi:AcrR family transcriptional regulator